ncbi:hypothetical protein [Methylomonas sp. AM2-LC]|uniref:hypothetical protein n=1 Tax=Methylomonas sp. AM2-LC TaxID=3153301 RepID=UPI0032646219
MKIAMSKTTKFMLITMLLISSVCANADVVRGYVQHEHPFYLPQYMLYSLPVRNYFGYEPPSLSQGLLVGNVGTSASYQMGKRNPLAAHIDITEEASLVSGLR